MQSGTRRLHLHSLVSPGRLLLLSSLTLLTACGEPVRPEVRIVTKLQMVYAEPDPALRNCMARLERRPVRNDNEIAQLIADSFEVGDDCRAKLAATWKSIDDARLRVETFNREQEAAAAREAQPQ